MNLQELISSINIFLTNEEKKFVKKYNTIKISSLDEHTKLIAQNLVRKGVYNISNDNNTLTKKIL